MSQDPVRKTWFHGRRASDLRFEGDRPAFFAAERDQVEQFSGPYGHVIEARIKIERPIDENRLLSIGDEMGLEDVLHEDYDGFPGASDYLFDSRMRRNLEQLGYDGYIDFDGPIYAAIVWNPAQIEIIDHRPFRAPREPGGTQPSAAVVPQIG